MRRCIVILAVAILSAFDSGAAVRVKELASVEGVRDNWAKIADEAGAKAYFNGGEQTQKFFRKMQGG